MNANINQKGLAEVLGVTARQVRNLTEDHGLPSTVDEQGRRMYVLGEAVQWYVAFKVAASRGGDSALEEAKLQKERLEVRRRQIEVARAEGEVITIDDHRAVVERIASAFRTSVLGVPGAWGPQVVGIVSAAEGTEVMRTCSEELLRDLASALADELEQDAPAPADGPLPDDFPGLAKLAAAGVTTWSKLRQLGDDYTRVPGIGPATAKAIAEYLTPTRAEAA